MTLDLRTEDLAAPLFVSVDSEAPITWAAFCDANADAFDPDELAEVRSHLERDGSFQAGGGAAADVLIVVSHSAPIGPSQSSAGLAGAVVAASD